jgi:hypothetical protein
MVSFKLVSINRDETLITDKDKIITKFTKWIKNLKLMS